MIFESTVSAYCGETMAISKHMFLGMKVIDAGTVSGLKCGLCKTFSMQDIKWCCVSTSVYKHKR